MPFYKPCNINLMTQVIGKRKRHKYLCSMTILSDSRLSLDIVRHLGEVVAEVSEDGLIHDIRLRDAEKYAGEEERYRGNKLSDIHPAEVAEKFTGLIKKALQTGESQYLEFQTSYKKQPAIYSVRILPYHPDSRLVYFIIDDITSKERLELKIGRASCRERV